MPTVNIPITLPQGVYDLAEKQGLLEPDALVDIIRRAVVDNLSPPPKKRWPKGWPKDKPLPEGVKPGMADLIDPETYGSMKTIGDIISPIDVEWEAMK